MVSSIVTTWKQAQDTRWQMGRLVINLLAMEGIYAAF